MSKANPLTEKQKKFIDQNKDRMTSREMAGALETTRYRIWNYIAKRNKEKLQETKKEYFNVNERDNWLINNQ